SREVPGVREELRGRRRADLPVGAAVADRADPELVEPLAAAAARRGRDPDRLEVARPAAGGDRGGDRALLGAHAERVGGVLDVDARELAPVARAHDRADEVARVGRVGPRRGGLRLLDEVAAAHPASWKRTSVVSAPSRPPSATSAEEWTPDSTRVCATSSAITSAIVDTRKRW